MAAVVTVEARATDMAINDSPDTRIKAIDAKTVLNASDPIGVLASIASDHHFKAMGAIRCDQQRVTPPWSAAWGQTPGDRDVMNVYIKALAQTASPQFTASRGVVLLGIHDDGAAEIATWGVDANDCKRLGTWGSMILNELPVAPFQTWYGWGNGGVPKRMAEDRIALLNGRQKLFVSEHTHPDAV